MSFDLAKIQKASIKQLAATLPLMDDAEEVQALLDMEQASTDPAPRSGAIAEIEKRAEQLAAAPATPPAAGEHASSPPPAAADVDGYLADVLAGDASTVKRKLETITNEHDLAQLVSIESSEGGRHRIQVYSMIEQRKRAIAPVKKKKGQVKPPVWLNIDTGEIMHQKEVRLIGPPVALPERGIVSQVYDCDLPEHNGRFKAQLSLVNGIPIGGTMGDYLQRIHAKPEA